MKYLFESYHDFLNERMKTQEIDPDKFPNPDQTPNPDFFMKGKQDGDTFGDVVETKPTAIPAKSLKPSQTEVFLGKALGLAIAGVEGGDLKAIISKDNRILDGHHRWAATMFNNPNTKVKGAKADLKIGDLVPVLRSAGDAFGNTRGFAPEGGDLNIFDATIKDIESAIYDGLYMDPKFYDREKAVAWYEKKGAAVIARRLLLLQRFGPPDGAPDRPNMPKIHPAQVKRVAQDLTAGRIDVRPPYKEN